MSIVQLAQIAQVPAAIDHQWPDSAQLGFTGASVLVTWDVDDTLVTWNPETSGHPTDCVRLVERFATLHTFFTLSQRKYQMMGFTARPACPWAATETVKVLRCRGIVFPSAPRLALSSLSSLYHEGILFMGGVHPSKGEALQEVLAAVDETPDYIVAIDDTLSHLEAMQRTVEAASLEAASLEAASLSWPPRRILFLGIHYTGAAAIQQEAGACYEGALQAIPHLFDDDAVK